MATLHIVNRASALASCLTLAGPQDAVLLIEDGVYAGVVPASRQLLALEDDVAARGLLDRMSESVRLVSYAGFVDLVVDHQPIASWR